MPLDAALVELEDRLERLAAALVVVKKRLADGCPDDSHCLCERMTDAVPAAEGWLRKALRAVRRAAGEPATARTALTRFELVFGKFRSTAGWELTGRGRRDELTKLVESKNTTDWAEWVGEVAAAAADLRRATAAVTRAQHACWRELAGQQAATAVVVNNTVAFGRPRKGGRAKRAR